MDHNPYSALSRLCYKYSCSSCDIRRVLGIMAEELEQIKEEVERKEGDDKTKDYEDPKKYWYITGEGDICRDDIEYSEGVEERKTVGNYFETKEEAEKAVEKLKAWKRLKDNGLTFKNWTRNQTGTIDCFANWNKNIPPSVHSQQLSDDLDLLFGGEE